MTKLKCWKRDYKGEIATHYSGKGKRENESIDIRDTGDRGILTSGYQISKGFVVSINSKEWKSAERVVLPSRKLAESEVKKWMKKHDKC